MDNHVEEVIVKNFFIKNRQNRIMYELSSPKKRIDAVWRLSSYHNILDVNFMIEIPKPNSNYMDIFKLLKNYGANDTAYVISFNSEFDGKHVDLECALKAHVGYGVPSLISCIPDKLLYYEGEQSYGPPPRLIFYKNNDGINKK